MLTGHQAKLPLRDRALSKHLALVDTRGGFELLMSVTALVQAEGLCITERMHWTDPIAGVFSTSTSKEGTEKTRTLKGAADTGRLQDERPTFSRQIPHSISALRRWASARCFLTAHCVMCSCASSGLFGNTQ